MDIWNEVTLNIAPSKLVDKKRKSIKTQNLRQLRQIQERSKKVKKGVLHLSEQQSRKVHGAISFPINIFLNSLADSYGEQAVGIIPSDRGSDGTQGLQSIKEHGGTALVQDPSTAEFDDMPQNAIATGIVDRVLSPGELAQLLYEYLGFPLDSDSY